MKLSETEKNIVLLLIDRLKAVAAGELLPISEEKSDDGAFKKFEGNDQHGWWFIKVSDFEILFAQE